MKDDRHSFTRRKLQALESRYRATIRKIREEMKRPLPDMFRLQNLKRRRVLLKDQITDLLSPPAMNTALPG